MKSGSSKYNEMPLPNRKIFDLIEEKTDGNVRKFADTIGIKQQSLNRLFNLDPRSNKYPSVSDDIINAIEATYGYGNAWLYADNIKGAKSKTRNLHSLENDADKIMDVWLRFMENQRQYNEIMKEMADLYKQIKGE